LAGYTLESFVNAARLFHMVAVLSARGLVADSWSPPLLTLSVLACFENEDEDGLVMCLAGRPFTPGARL
jgi:hypothetical protein